jgi:hypothetical protein
VTAVPAPGTPGELRCGTAHTERLIKATDLIQDAITEATEKQPVGVGRPFLLGLPGVSSTHPNRD